jgi:cobalt-zinc-cadmium efflux system outer membrane protein
VILQSSTICAQQVVTLERALRLAEQNNPSLRTADADTAIAGAAIRTARGRPNPDFNFLAGHQRNTRPTNISGKIEHYGVTQLIELPSVRRARIKAATVGRETAELARRNEGLSVTADVKFAFYDVLRRQGQVDLTEETLRLAADLRRRIEVQVDVGEAARLELTRAETEESADEAQVRGARLQLLTAKAALRAVVGEALPDQFNAQGNLTAAVTLPSLDDLKKDVLAQHPALAEAQSEVRLADAEVDHEKVLRKPQPAVVGEFERQPDLNFFRLGVVLPLPIFNRREGPIAEAEARAARANSLAQAKRLELSTALEQAYGAYEIAGQKIAAYEQGALREAEASLTAAEAAWRLGQRGILEVLDAQRVLRAARADHLGAQFDRQDALTELDRLRGDQFGRGNN